MNNPQCFASNGESPAYAAIQLGKWIIITSEAYRQVSNTVKPVYNDHLIGYFSAFWSSSRWPRAT